MMKLRTLRDAWQLLSSPQRRQVYDEKLKARESITYEVVETRPLPWATILLLTAVLFGGGFYYHHIQQKKERLAGIELATAKAKAEAERVAMRTAEVEAALERQRQARIQQEEATNRALTAQARYEGQRIHTDMQNFQRQVALDKERERREATQRSREEIARMERALSIPIRH